MIDLDELEKLAKSATPGPWEWEEPSKESWPSGDESLVTTWNEEDGYPKSVVTSWGYDADGVTASAEDRAFIAAAYPQAVLELIERVRRVEAERDAALARIAELEPKHPEGWSTEDRQEAKQEAERRWSRPVSREAEQRYNAGNINGFILGAEWQKARETFISYKAIANEAEARIAEAAKLHQREVIAVHEGHGEEAWCPQCEEHWPCPTAVALGLNEGESDD